MKKNWRVLQSTEAFHAGPMRLRIDECALPDGRVMPRYFVLEFPDWVNVVALTSEGQVLAIDQYRHAAQAWFLEIPGGSMDLNKKENPLDTAHRELLEETGYQAKEMVHIGSHFPNPALQNNRMHTFLAKGCVKVGEAQLDPFEDLTLRLMSIEELYSRADNGEVSHSLILASLALARAYL